MQSAAKTLLIAFMALSFIAQSYGALSAACPKLMTDSSQMENTPCHMEDGKQAPAMEESANQHKQADNSQNCCGETSCPMNSLVGTALLNITPQLSTPFAEHMNLALYQGNHYLSVQAKNLLRPPITH